MRRRWALFLTMVLGAARLGAAPPAGLALSPPERAWVAAHPVIRIQMARASAPFEFRDAEGHPQGLSYDTLQLACGRLGLSVQVTDLAWSVALAAIQAPAPPVDLLLGVTDSDLRRSQMLLTRTYSSFPYVIFTTKSHPFIGGMGDLLHATVAVEQDDVMEDWLRRDLPLARVVAMPENRQVLEAVSDGRADAYVGNLAIGSYTIERLGLVNLKVAAPAPYGFDSYSFGVRRDWPQLVSLLDKALASLSPEEEAALRLRWLQVRYDYGLRWQDLLLWLGLGVIVAAAFIVQLRRMVRRRTAELAGEVRRRRDAEQGLRQSLAREQEVRQHLAGILEFLPDATMVLDPGHKVQAWNQAMERLSGLPQAQVVGQASALCAPAFFGGAQPFLADYVLNGQEPPAGDYILLQRQGPVLMAQRLVPGLRGGRGAWLYATAAALLDADGRVLGAIESIRDITEQKALEAQLAQAQRLEAIGTLAAGIAHDFNNILSAAGGYADLALARAQDPALREDLQGITRATARAAEVVRQILAFSRVKPEAPRPLQPGPLVREALTLLRATIPAGVTLGAELNSQALVLADPAEIHRVVVNLCANAAAATRGQGSLRVTLEDVTPDAALRAALPALGPGPQVRLRVEDDGDGMAPAVMARIFEPFYTTRPDAGGTGMGLAVVHGIVSGRGGAIQVESVPGDGSRFSVYWPALPAETLPAEAPAARLGAAPPSAAPPGRLMLVDDEPELLHVLTRSLQRLGWVVEAFGDPEAAWARLQSGPGDFAALVTDRSMPGMGGAALAAKAKALAPRMPVLLCTGYDDGGTAAGGNLDRVLQKPVNMAELDAELRALTSRIDPPRAAP